MENNILDEVESDDNPKYGLRAYGYFLKTSLCILTWVIGLPLFGKNFSFNLYFQIESLLVIAILIFPFLGIWNSLKGERLDEKSTTKIKVGKVGLTIFILIFVILFFTNILPLLMEIILI